MRLKMNSFERLTIAAAQPVESEPPAASSCCAMYVPITSFSRWACRRACSFWSRVRRTSRSFASRRLPAVTLPSPTISGSSCLRRARAASIACWAWALALPSRVPCSRSSWRMRSPSRLNSSAGVSPMRPRRPFSRPARRAAIASLMVLPLPPPPAAAVVGIAWPVIGSTASPAAACVVAPAFFPFVANTASCALRQMSVAPERESSVSLSALALLFC
jgi:xanthosine utilization system XapX-like protein